MAINKYYDSDCNLGVLDGKTTLCKAISMGIAGQNDRIREGRGPGMPGPYRSINQKRMPSTKQHPL